MKGLRTCCNLQRRKAKGEKVRRPRRNGGVEICVRQKAEDAVVGKEFTVPSGSQQSGGVCKDPKPNQMERKCSSRKPAGMEKVKRGKKRKLKKKL